MFGRSEFINEDIIETKESIKYLKSCVPNANQIEMDIFMQLLENISIHGLLVNKLNLLIEDYIKNNEK